MHRGPGVHQLGDHELRGQLDVVPGDRGSERRQVPRNRASRESFLTLKKKMVSRVWSADMWRRVSFTCGNLGWWLQV